MKKFNILKSTIERYKNLGYSEKTIECLIYLECRCENLGDFLEEYRHLQPDGKPFSEGILGIIKELHEIQVSLQEQYYEILTIRDQVAITSKDPEISWDLNEDLF